MLMFSIAQSNTATASLRRFVERGVGLFIFCVSN